MNIRSWLYTVARLMGDVNAISRGPKAVVKRQVRKAALKATGRLLRRLVK